MESGHRDSSRKGFSLCEGSNIKTTFEKMGTELNSRWMEIYDEKRSGRWSVTCVD